MIDGINETSNSSMLLLPFTKHAMIAIFGALTHALVMQREGKSKGIWDFIILILISSFSGVIFSMLAMHLFPTQQYLSLAIAGTGGYMGVEGMTLVVKYLAKKIK